MTPKERLVAALERKKADHLPATTHHLMPYFLNKYMGGVDNLTFFKDMGLDPIIWSHHDRYRPEDLENWRVVTEDDNSGKYPAWKYTVHTPGGDLTARMEYNEITSWLTEHLIKEKKDIELLAKYMPGPYIDVDGVNAEADKYPEFLIRGTVFCGDIFGQPGCWQQACCFYGVENMIMECYDDPEWVYEFLKIMQRPKIAQMRSSKGARFDLIELGGGDASTTVISPKIFNEFVAPYDSEIIRVAHEAGQRIVYHTCGGMMPILEDIAAMGTDAMETFTPPGMGGDTDLAEAKRRIGDKVCMIGGLDQQQFFGKCSAEETRKEVRRCFEAAGQGGGFILSPSDHFFDSDPELIRAFADEAAKCLY